MIINRVVYEVGTCESVVCVWIKYELNMNRIGRYDSNSNQTSNWIGIKYHLTCCRTIWQLQFLFHLFSLCTTVEKAYHIWKIKRDVQNYRFLIPVLKHIKQYRCMITHRASKSAYCTTEGAFHQRRSNLGSAEPGWTMMVIRPGRWLVRFDRD